MQVMQGFWPLHFVRAALQRSQARVMRRLVWPSRAFGQELDGLAEPPAWASTVAEGPASPVVGLLLSSSSSSLTSGEEACRIEEEPGRATEAPWASNSRPAVGEWRGRWACAGGAPR